MLTLRIPEISATAGDMNDGFVRGEVKQSLFSAVLTNSLIAPNVYVVRKDKSSGATTFTDISASAISLTPFELFGSTAQMSAGDGVLIACDHEVKEMWFDVDTAGVGTWGVLEVYYSSNGKTFDKLHTNIVDGTNAFKTTGVKKVSFDSAAHSALSPVPEDITERKWMFLTLKDFVSVTTAPKTKGVYIIHADSAVTWRDKTADRNASMTDSAFSGSSTTSFHAVGGEQIYVLSFLGYGLDFNVFRRYTQDMTRVKEYLAADGTWKALADVVDGSNDWENGPTSLTTAYNSYTLRWTIPSDWVSKTMTFNMDGGGTQTFTGYFVRYRITAILAPAPTLPALFRARARAFGIDNANGIYHPASASYSSVSFDIGIPSTSEMKVQFINVNTGKGVTATIPANINSSGDMSGQRAVLSPALAMSAGDSLAIAHMSGGTLKDVEVRL